MQKQRRLARGGNPDDLPPPPAARFEVRPARRGAAAHRVLTREVSSDCWDSRMSSDPGTARTTAIHSQALHTQTTARTTGNQKLSEPGTARASDCSDNWMFSDSVTARTTGYSQGLHANDCSDNWKSESYRAKTCFSEK